MMTNNPAPPSTVAGNPASSSTVAGSSTHTGEAPRANNAVTILDPLSLTTSIKKRIAFGALTGAVVARMLFNYSIISVPATGFLFVAGAIAGAAAEPTVKGIRHLRKIRLRTEISRMNNGITEMENRDNENKAILKSRVKNWPKNKIIDLLWDHCGKDKNSRENISTLATYACNFANAAWDRVSYAVVGTLGAGVVAWPVIAWSLPASFSTIAVYGITLTGSLSIIACAIPVVTVSAMALPYVPEVLHQSLLMDGQYRETYTDFTDTLRRHSIRNQWVSESANKAGS